MTRIRHRPAWQRLALGVAVFAIAGIGVFALMLKNWTVAESFDASTAAERYATLLDEMGDTRPYLTRMEDGSLRPHPEILPQSPKPVDALAVVSWNPKSERWIRTDFPFWFVRMKMQGGITVGMLHAALEQDWSHLQLDLDAEDLAARGPGLLLDIQEDDGRRILLWNAAEER